MRRLLPLFLAGLVYSCGGGAESNSVVVSVNPLNLYVREMDSTVRVILAVGKNANPHIFDPSPRLVEEMNSACAIVYINSNFEQWVRGLSTGKKLELAPHAKNPHVWFDPVFMLEKVDTVASLLGECGYRVDASALKENLKKIDSTIRVQSAEIKKKIVLAHPSLKPLFDRYGIPVYSILFSKSGADLIPSEMRKVLSLPPDSVIILKEVIFPDKDFEIFTSRGYRLVEFDPFGFQDSSYSQFISGIWEKIYENAR